MTLIELIWTITPAVILILIAFPSFKLLYLMDEVDDSSMSVLAEGSLKGGPKSYILNKREDTCYTFLIGQKNNKVKLVKVWNRFENNLIHYQQCSMFHTLVRAKNRIGPHNEDVISVLIGSLLGDSYASNRSGEGTRFCYRQSEKHSYYLFWLYDFFHSRGYCSNLKPRKYTRKIRNECKLYYGYEFNTFTFRSFNWIHKMFYKKGIKYINKEIEQYLTPLALAILILSKPAQPRTSLDGRRAKGYEEFNLYTGLRREEDINKLILILKNRYGFICYSIKDQNSFYGISIANESKDSFIALVQPYLYNIEKSIYAQ